MKKIMGAVLAAAMLAGTVTAADVGFSYTGANLFSVAEVNSSSTSSDKYPAFLGRRDCLSVSLTTDVAGVVVDYDVEDNAADKLHMDEYYGWLNFGLPVGSLQVTTGVWNGRNVNRVLTDRFDLDAGDAGYELFERHKPGVTNGTWGYDSSNLTLGRLGLVGAWTLADALPGTLMVKLGLVDYRGKSAPGIGLNGKFVPGDWNPNEDSFNVVAGFAAEASYRQEGAFGATFSARSFNKNSYSFGAWITPELADTLQLTVGGTVATGKEYASGTWSDRKFEYGIDFRLRLQVTDDLSITTLNNLSAGYGKDGLTGDKTGMLWNMLNATYAFADNLKASFTVNSEADVFCPVANDKDDADWTLYITPALIIQASERARVTAAVHGKIPQVRNYAIKNIELTIPVAFSFNY